LVKQPRTRIVPGVAIALAMAGAVGLTARGLRRWVIDARRGSALLSYRNGLVIAEVTRVEQLLGRTPPRTLADVARVVGATPSTCDDRNEPGPLDDPRTEPCSRGAACHEPFFMADWYVRRHVEASDPRVWFDRKLDADNSAGKLRVRVAGCQPGDLVVSIDRLEPARFAIDRW
jgi:hypothetical protein